MGHKTYSQKVLNKTEYTSIIHNKQNIPIPWFFERNNYLQWVLFLDKKAIPVKRKIVTKLPIVQFKIIIFYGNVAQR